MAKRMTAETRRRAAMTPEKRQALAVDLVACGMTYQRIADTLGYRSRSGARNAYFTALVRAALAEREPAPTA